MKRLWHTWPPNAAFNWSIDLLYVTYNMADTYKAVQNVEFSPHCQSCSPMHFTKVMLKHVFAPSEQSKLRFLLSHCTCSQWTGKDSFLLRSFSPLTSSLPGPWQSLGANPAHHFCNLRQTISQRLPKFSSTVPEHSEVPSSSIIMGVSVTERHGGGQHKASTRTHKQHSR